MLLSKNPPNNEYELLERCQALEGLSLAQLASLLECRIPEHPLQRKGWTGQAIERFLGATAGSRSAPDFCHLGIELKTIPINALGKPRESTFITSISLLTLHQEAWASSLCYAKLKRVLWVPVEGDPSIPFVHRRIGHGVLWSPSIEQERVLADDWTEFALMIGTGQLAEIDASMGQYLQIRPKAANSKALCYGFDEKGDTVLTLPRGFYLRSRFTALLL